MTDKLNPTYFEERRREAVEQALICAKLAEEAAALISAMNYQLPDLVPPQTVHNALRAAAEAAETARYQFEQSRWAASPTTVSFADWLRSNGCADLIRYGV